jgi:hypothetical protein
MASYNTNLASEFYVLSALYRLGLDASLTLGNKKSVDIVVVRETGDTITIDVKAVVGKYDWPVNNVQDQPRANHFIVLISYEGKIQDLATLPSAWVLPHADVARFVKEYAGGSRKNLARALINNAGQPYKDAWHLLTDSAAIALQAS